MKYIFCLLILATLSGCFRDEEESPCPNYVNDVMDYSPLVFSFIDADSTNLLENKTIDSTDISIKDDKGSIQKFSVFLDSTGTKARFISIPIIDKLGTNELKISVKNKENSLKYDFTVVNSACGSYYLYDNYLLNNSPYKIRPKLSYYMVGKQKIQTVFRVIYIKE
ncbi:hypothetical protein [Arcticibacter eurypsychrophilus]|uniref:hypothetical protein n=1 Tax=Arcticibacter eurypsychrophilus TaxID=1434752 RepID=UPI00084DEA51|nr:hypothetical protein [Arcticibacter eurypsychrophilus]